VRSERGLSSKGGGPSKEKGASWYFSRGTRILRKGKSMAEEQM